MSAPRHVQPDRVGDNASPALPAGYTPSLIRTWVPVLVGSLITWALTHWNIVLPPDASSTLVTIVAGLVIAGYYALARALERKWPRVGAVLLAAGLVQAKPVYADPAESVRLINTETGEVTRVDPTTRP